MEPVVFEATILKNEGKSGGCYIEFPFNTEQVFGIKGRFPVICTFDGAEYCGSLVKMGGNCHIVGVLKEVMAKIGKNPGDLVTVSIVKDTTERKIVPNSSLQPFLDSDGVLRANYEKLSYTKKREINLSLESAKKEETKQSRLQKILSDCKSSNFS